MGLPCGEVIRDLTLAGAAVSVLYRPRMYGEHGPVDVTVCDEAAVVAAGSGLSLEEAIAALELTDGEAAEAALHRGTARIIDVVEEVTRDR